LYDTVVAVVKSVPCNTIVLPETVIDVNVPFATLNPLRVAGANVFVFIVSDIVNVIAVGLVSVAVVTVGAIPSATTIADVVVTGVKVAPSTDFSVVGAAAVAKLIAAGVVHIYYQ
jgi:hypothetical protein